MNSEKKGLFGRLTSSLKKTGSQLRGLFSTPQLDEDFLDDLTDTLIMADVGVKLTETIITELQQQLPKPPSTEAVKQTLQQILIAKLKPLQRPLNLSERTNIVLMIGINGAGKTTSIGKLAHVLQQQGKQVMLAAGDTFRAAAVEQLLQWGQRNKVPVVHQATGADSAAVIFDAINSATAKQVDVLIADTAGRLHTQANLMAELAKIVRVADKAKPGAPHEIILVIDATQGQNAINQLRQFSEAVPISGIIITKLDGTAKGGIVLALATEFSVPIYFVGTGEQADDLQAFNADNYITAMLNDD